MKYDSDIADKCLRNSIMHPASPEEVSCRGNCFYAFNSSLKYSSQEYAATVCKKSGRDFVILSLADIQCHDGEAFSEVGRFYEETVDRLIKKNKAGFDYSHGRQRL